MVSQHIVFLSLVIIKFIVGVVTVEQTGYWCFQIQSWTASGSASDKQQVRVAGDGQASEQAEEAGGRKQELGQSLCRLPHRCRLSGNAKNTSM